MIRSDQIRTYIVISVAIVSLLATVPLGIDLAKAPDRATVSIFITAVSVLLLSGSVLWGWYTQRPRDDPKYWRQRAKEARTHANQLIDPASQRVMLEMAADYEELARRAEERPGRD